MISGNHWTAGGLSAHPALKGKDQVSQREPWGPPNAETVFKSTASWVRTTRGQKRQKHPALSGWGSGTCLWNSRVMGSTIVKFQNHCFRQDFRAYLGLIWKEIMFTHEYKHWLYPITLTFHCLSQALCCFKWHVAHRSCKPISPVVLKQPSLVNKHAANFSVCFLNADSWFKRHD